MKLGHSVLWATVLFVITGLFTVGVARADWWEQPHDKWYLKDDWKAAMVNNYNPTIKLQSPAASGWIVAWGRNGFTLKANGNLVREHVDRALIYDADLTPFIKGAGEVALEFGRARVVVEGELADDEGRRYPFGYGVLPKERDGIEKEWRRCEDHEEGDRRGVHEGEGNPEIDPVVHDPREADHQRDQPDPRA